MVREPPLDAPALKTIATAVESALGWSVNTVTPFDEGLNAVYRVARADGEPAVVKTATFASDEELLTEAALLSRVGTGSNVPLPSVYATIKPDGSTLDVAAFVMEYCDGRQVTDLLSLSPAAQSRLVVESGRHLAAIHDVPVADGFGPLRKSGDSIVAKPRHESWDDWFDELAADALDGLRGEGFTTDDDPRFADLEPAIRETIIPASGVTGGRDRAVDPAVVFSDYRPSNLVLAPDESADQIVRAVVDLGNGPTGDGLLDLALAEDALVDVPLGGTGRATRLRAELRAAYCDERGIDPDALDGAWYTRYRLYARTRRMAAFGYWAQFAREDESDAVERRWRSFVGARLDELD